MSLVLEQLKVSNDVHDIKMGDFPLMSFLTS